MRLMGVFTFPSENTLFHGTRVIVRTSRGQEIGTVLCEATEKALAIREIPLQTEESRILRVMTPEDEKQAKQITPQEADELQRTQAIVERMNIPMSLIRVEHIFGGERLIVYYVADGRIDFRELVKVLAGEFQTRIEMRQIGVRDETKLLADVGDCGREVCCNTYLNTMPPVSMKMAKLQKATLNPAKISGRCGRLKCCLRYEYDVYSELQDTLPQIGSTVQTPDGIGKVLSQELLAKKLLIETEDHTRKYVSADDVIVIKKGFAPNEDPSSDEFPEKEIESFEETGNTPSGFTREQETRRSGFRYGNRPRTTRNHSPFHSQNSEYPRQRGHRS